MKKIHTFFTDAVSNTVVEEKGIKEHYVNGYVSTPDQDLYNDIVTEKALSNMLKDITNPPKPEKLD